jgi:hypothetical protein
LVGGGAADVCRGQISHPVNELLDFTEDPVGVLFAALEHRHPARGHADFLQQGFDGLSALVRPQIALEMTALVFFAGNYYDTVGAGLKRLDQVRDIHLARTGQTDGLDDVSLHALAKAGKLAGLQIIGAIKNIRFHDPIAHKTIGCCPKKLFVQACHFGVAFSTATRRGLRPDRAAGAFANGVMQIVLLEG